MKKTKKIEDLKISDFPEAVDEANGVRIYGETSYENQMALISHYLHNGILELTDDRKLELLSALREFLSRKQILQGNKEELSDEDIWKAAESPMQYTLFDDFFRVPFPAPKNPKFTFIDLFAGIGGFRIAMQNLGGKCVYSSEFDAKAQESYFANYGEMPFGDITKESTKSFIPDEFDILCGGFPCQAFSLAGRRLGFKDETRGTLFFEIEDILRRHQPKAFFLENVKGLAIHDKGRTLKTILEHLNDAGYDVVPPQILNAMDFGVPQHRERIYIIGFRKDLGIDVKDYHYPEPTTPGDKRPKFRDVMEKEVVSVKYYLSTVYVETLRRHRARHEAAGHGFGYKIIDLDGVANAIVVGGMGREGNLIIDHREHSMVPMTHIKGEINKDDIRKMTPREWARLQGFPDSYKLSLSDTHLYKQFGNSVTVKVIEAIARNIKEVLDNAK